MFGIAVARLDQLTEDEKIRYQSLYCGLCRTLKQRYSQVSTAALSYDLTFFVMLCNSLHEPSEDSGKSTCISHPFKEMPYVTTEWSNYAADLSVALAYHKCLDDVADDNSIKANIASKMLSSAYEKAKNNIPEECDVIEQSMKNIRQIENDTDSLPDDAASEFGRLLGFIFAKNQSIWEETMHKLGFQLGKFIYLMDAAIDVDEDIKNKSYNPFATLDFDQNDLRALLMNSIGDVTFYFEKLPVIQDEHILQCILYSGVWQKFNQKYEIPSKDTEKQA